MRDQDPGELLTVPEAAELLKVSAVTVSRWLKHGRLPAYRVGPRAVRIRRADIDQVLAPASATTSGTTGTDPTRPSQPSPLAFGGNSGLATRADRLALNDEIAALRNRILSRRRGQTFVSAADDLAKTRRQRRKRL